MHRKAQSALEYMMTYGWAILIIVIVAGVLYSMGIFNPSASTGTTATGFSPLVVLAQQCSVSNGFEIQFGNNAGASITWVSEVPSSTSGITGAGDGNVTSGSTANGGSRIVKFTGSTCASAGSRYSASITVTYTKSNGGLGSETLQATGTVSGTTSS